MPFIHAFSLLPARSRAPFVPACISAPIVTMSFHVWTSCMSFSLLSFYHYISFLRSQYMHALTMRGLARFESLFRTACHMRFMCADSTPWPIDGGSWRLLIQWNEASRCDTRVSCAFRPAWVLYWAFFSLSSLPGQHNTKRLQLWHVSSTPFNLCTCFYMLCVYFRPCLACSWLSLALSRFSHPYITHEPCLTSIHHT